MQVCCIDAAISEPAKPIPKTLHCIDRGFALAAVFVAAGAAAVDFDACDAVAVDVAAAADGAAAAS
jgi:hypothetical protein